MYYHLIHQDKNGDIWSEIYTVKGMAEDEIKRRGIKALVIEEPGYAKFTNYGLVQDLTDHTKDL